MKKTTIAFIAAVLTVMACGSRKENSMEKTVGTSTSIKGDSTLYGLACDGCTDSALVFLPGKGGDPVTYNIIEAKRKGRVAGKLNVGDWVCLTLDGSDKKKAHTVINLDRLKGSWVQLVMPTRKNRPGRKSDMDEEARLVEDSLAKAMMIPREIGFALKRHYTAAPIGMQRAANLVEDENMLVYPSPKFYTEWHIFNGKLILTEGAFNIPGQKVKAKKKYSNDTVDVVMLTKDSLRLKFSNGKTEGYYRK